MTDWWQHQYHAGRQSADQTPVDWGSVERVLDRGFAHGRRRRTYRRVGTVALAATVVLAAAGLRLLTDGPEDDQVASATALDFRTGCNRQIERADHNVVVGATLPAQYESRAMAVVASSGAQAVLCVTADYSRGDGYLVPVPNPAPSPDAFTSSDWVVTHIPDSDAYVIAANSRQLKLGTYGMFVYPLTPPVPQPGPKGTITRKGTLTLYIFYLTPQADASTTVRARLLSRDDNTCLDTQCPAFLATTVGQITTPTGDPDRIASTQ
jgi:hypothetical protein